MKRRSLMAVSFCLVLIFLHPCLVFNQEGKVIRVQGFMGASSPMEKNIGAGLWSSIGFSIPVMLKLFLSLDFGHWTSEVNGSAGELLEGTVYVNPFIVSAAYFLMPDRAITPYVFIGGGFVFSRFRLGDIITIPEISLSQKIESGPGGKIGLGMVMDLTENVSLVGEASYLFRVAQAKTTVQDLNFGLSVEDFTVNLNTFILHLGFRYTVQ
jgi:outer membrane protein W